MAAKTRARRKFDDVILEYVGNTPKTGANNNKPSGNVSSDEENMMNDAEARVAQGSRDNTDVKLANAKKKYKVAKAKKTDSIEDKITQLAEAEVPEVEAPGSEAPIEAPVQAGPEPMTTEGEAFLTNMARRAISVDLDTMMLTDEQRSAVTTEVTPENAKLIQSHLTAIIDEYNV